MTCFTECAAYGCFEVRVAKGLCRKHYQQLRKFGTINRIVATAWCRYCNGNFTPRSKTSVFCGRRCALRWRRVHPDMPRPKPDIVYTEFLETGTFKPIKAWELDGEGNLVDATEKYIDPHRCWPEVIEADRRNRHRLGVMGQ